MSSPSIALSERRAGRLFATVAALLFLSLLMLHAL
jgi:hypothetical protein